MHKRMSPHGDYDHMGEVINLGGYIGSSTKSEIEYAISKGKKVNYLEK